jgi:hypothetical protein
MVATYPGIEPISTQSQEVTPMPASHL